MSWREIRPIVVALVTRESDLLVFEAEDPTTEETFYRPLGGGIEFDEDSLTALRREFREELDAEIVDPEYRGTVENRFTYAGERGHEIVLVYAADLADDTYYERDSFAAYEESTDTSFRVVWKPIETFEAGDAVLYPEGILRFV